MLFSLVETARVDEFIAKTADAEKRTRRRGGAKSGAARLDALRRFERASCVSESMFPSQQRPFGFGDRGRGASPDTLRRHVATRR